MFFISDINIFNLEHYGTDDPEEVVDPLDEEFIQNFVERAYNNTRIYNEVFKAEPDNTQKTFDDLQKDRDDYDNMGSVEQMNKYEEYKDQIIGHIVDYPVNYLIDQNLELNMTDMANLVPAINFC